MILPKTKYFKAYFPKSTLIPPLFFEKPKTLSGSQFVPMPPNKLASKRPPDGKPD